MTFTPAVAGFRVDAKVANVAFMVTKTMENKDKSSAGLSSREHHQLMMVMKLTAVPWYHMLVYDMACFNMLQHACILDGLEHVLTCVVFVLEHGSLFQLLSKAWFKMNWR